MLRELAALVAWVAAERGAVFLREAYSVLLLGSVVGLGCGVEGIVA